MGQKSLVSIVETLETAIEQKGFVLGSETISIPEDNLKEAVATIDAFFQENKLALAVAQKAASYSSLIEPIISHYSTTKNKLRAPREDTDFDEYTREIISSLNEVGVAAIDHTYFMTKPRQQKIRQDERLTLSIFGLVAGTELVTAHYRNVPFDAATEIFFSGLVLTLPYIFLKWHEHYRPMAHSIQELKTAAEKTDMYLHKVGEKYG
ncbi:hypothetical protein HY496_03370 [Candidatus Woesearchaeota archaeon]|nr:hypothetical protein [Candidatus Woesearchaeota archaeon]